MHTPVALIIFNRPDTTEKVFAEIAKAKPRNLFVIADGPRHDHPDDIEKCAAAQAIIDRVDWECEVSKNFSDVNLGCGHRPASGISWAFKNVEQAIILEDDCVPHPSFFYFCEELLEKFRDDERIMQICGNNYQLGFKRTSDSYFFSYFNICAGAWATWRRAWHHFDMEMNLWPILRDTPWLSDIVGDPQAIKFWQDIFDRAYSSPDTADYWDYQWRFAVWKQRGLSVLPNTTLVTNIGFREDGTHTKTANHVLANLTRGEMAFPLQHPPHVITHREADQFLIERSLKENQQRSSSRLRRKLSAAIPGPARKLISYLRAKSIQV